MKIATSIIIFLCAFFAPVAPILLAVGCAVGIDTLFGMYAVVKSKGRKSIKSDLAFKGIGVKTLVYGFSIVLIFIIDHNFLSELINSYFKIKIEYLPTKIVSALFIFIELISSYENLNKILGYDLIDKLKSVLRKAKTVKEDVKKLKDGNNDK